MRKKNIEAIICKQIKELKAYEESLNKKLQTIEQDMWERYPMDMYGVKAISVIEDKTADLQRDIKEVGLYIRGLKNITLDVKEVMHD